MSTRQSARPDDAALVPPVRQVRVSNHGPQASLDVTEPCVRPPPPVFPGWRGRPGDQLRLFSAGLGSTTFSAPPTTAVPLTGRPCTPPQSGTVLIMSVCCVGPGPVEKRRGVSSRSDDGDCHPLGFPGPDGWANRTEDHGAVVETDAAVFYR